MMDSWTVRNERWKCGSARITVRCGMAKMTLRVRLSKGSAGSLERALNGSEAWRDATGGEVRESRVFLDPATPGEGLIVTTWIHSAAAIKFAARHASMLSLLEVDGGPVQAIEPPSILLRPDDPEAQSIS